jgi:hypothetical protein
MSSHLRTAWLLLLCVLHSLCVLCVPTLTVAPLLCNHACTHAHTIHLGMMRCTASWAPCPLLSSRRTILQGSCLESLHALFGPCSKWMRYLASPQLGLNPSACSSCSVLDHMQREGLVQRVVEVIIDEGREVRVRLSGGTRQRLVGVVAPVQEALLRLHRHLNGGAAAPGSLGGGLQCGRCSSGGLLMAVLAAARCLAAVLKH